MASKASPASKALRGVPFIPIVLTLGACITVGLWYSYMGHALAGTKRAAYLMLMPVPPAFVTVPSLFIATLVSTVVLSLIALALAVLRGQHARAGRGAATAAYVLPAAGAADALLYLLVVWLAIMFAITALWAGAAMVSEKSTADASVTLRSVDPAIHRLIFQASGGAINGTETGFIVSVGDPKGPKRDVDIGKSSCSLFCFVFARAMMSDSNECYCDAPIMAEIHSLASALLHKHLVPATICALATLLFVLGLLVSGAAQFGAADAERRGAAAAGAEGEGGYKVYAEQARGTAAGTVVD